MLAAELLPVARGLPERLVVDERRLHLEVAAARVLARRRSSSTFQIAIPFGCQNGEPGEALLEVEEVELRPEPPVVVRARLLEPLEVRVEVGLREERRAVDPRQLRVLLVAAPVRAGEARQLDRLDRRRVLEVRPAAEVGEVALRVERDVAVRGVDQLDLVRLALGLEARARLLAADLRRAPTTGPPRARAAISSSIAARSASWIGSGNSKS